jgi:hypothetical protein
MKTTLLFLVCLSVMLGACGTEDEVISPLWGITYSEANTSGFATGTVDQYVGDTKTTYLIKSAMLRNINADVYVLQYNFESGDVIEIRIAKRTVDRNYTFPGAGGENQLLSATLNGEILQLTTESRISVEPRTGENKVATLPKLLTKNFGVFDGAIGRVPLLK